MKIEDEFAGVSLGDERLNARVLELAKSFELKHGKSISYTCSDWSASKAAYRFFDSDRFLEDDIVAPHIKATVERVASVSDKVLVLHDTTDLVYPRHHIREGLGHITKHQSKNGVKELITYGILLHMSLAVTTEGVPLGLMHQEQWCRDKLKCRRIRNSKVNYTRVPVEEKESYKWLKGIEKSCESSKPEQLVHVCDRDADMYELFDKCRALNTNFVVRAVHSRGTSKSGVKSFDRLSTVRTSGTYSLEIKANRHRSARTAKIAVRFYKVRLIPPLDKSKKYESTEVYVVSARENSPNVSTSKSDKISWKLLTNMPVKTFSDALTVIQYYQARWDIETYFKTLKSGFALEHCRLRHADRIKKYTALVSVLAWKIFWLTKVSRACPDEPPKLAFGKKEIKVIQAIELKQGRQLSTESRSLYDYTVAVARLGGYLARKSDPPPGIIVLWRGMQRLYDIMTFHS